MKYCPHDCPMLRIAICYEPYGDTVARREEAYCAMGEHPDDCSMNNESEEINYVKKFTNKRK